MLHTIAVGAIEYWIVRYPPGIVIKFQILLYFVLFSIDITFEHMQPTNFTLEYLIKVYTNYLVPMYYIT